MHLIVYMITFNWYTTLASSIYTVYHRLYQFLWQPHPLLQQGTSEYMNGHWSWSLSCNWVSKASHTCSIGLRSGDFAGHSQSLNILRSEILIHQLSFMWADIIIHKDEVWFICSVEKSHIWNKDLISVSLICQSTYIEHMKVGTPVSHACLEDQYQDPGSF